MGAENAFILQQTYLLYLYNKHLSGTDLYICLIHIVVRYFRKKNQTEFYSILTLGYFPLEVKWFDFNISLWEKDHS